MKISSLIIAVFVCLSVWAVIPTFKCEDLRSVIDCKKIPFCTWKSTCNLDGPVSGEGCSGECLEDKCLKMLNDTETCAELTTVLRSSFNCLNGSIASNTGNVSKHYCDAENISREDNNYFCKNDTTSVSACFLNYLKTEGNCTHVDGQYCKLYDVVGGKVCENAKSYDNVIGQSCECLSVENCKYNPACYISGSLCATDPCNSSYSYNILTQKCDPNCYVSGSPSSCSSCQYECVPKAVTQVLISYDYENKTATPLKTVYNDWEYKAKRNQYFTSYICIDEKRHKTPPNTCYNLSFSIFRNPTFLQQNNTTDQTQRWWNYVADSEERDDCNWWTGTTIDATSCTNHTGCSVVDVGADKICTSDVSAGSSFIRSPSFVFILIFVGVLSFLSK